MAGRLRPLRRALHPDELALRRHLPHRGRPRRRRRRCAAFRPAQQLARQRQPGQGAPAALAGQAEVRPEDLLGRPDRLRRQRRHGVDGLPDLRLRVRPGGHLGARGDLLGPGGHVARRRALQRGAGPRPEARRRPDGPDLRQSGGAQRQPRPARLGPGHPGDLPPHGDERRGDRRPDRRRPHLRQDPRRGARRLPRPRAGGRTARAAGPGLEEQLRLRQGPGHDHQRPRGHLVPDADAVEQLLLREPLRLRVGADREPGRREAVGRQGCPEQSSPTRRPAS